MKLEDVLNALKEAGFQEEQIKEELASLKQEIEDYIGGGNPEEKSFDEMNEEEIAQKKAEVYGL